MQLKHGLARQMQGHDSSGGASGSMIECTSVYGNKVRIPKSKLMLRPTVYAIIVNEGKMLLIRSRYGGKYFLPGGGIETGERIEVALRREVKEETGIEIDALDFAYFQEDFFYYDPHDAAYHSLQFYYFCRPRTLRLLDDAEVDDEDAEKPRWIDIGGLQACDFQNHGEVILGFLRSQSAGAQRAGSSLTK
jgi:nucleoside triphosphatase